MKVYYAYSDQNVADIVRLMQDPDTLKTTQSLVMDDIAKGLMEPIYWLLGLYPTLFDEIYEVAGNPVTLGTAAFRTACAEGRLHVVQWLHSHVPTLDMRYLGYWPLDSACTFGHIDVIQWLLDPGLCLLRDEDRVRVHRQTLLRACRYAHLHIARWLHATFAFDNAGGLFNEALNDACAAGQLEVAQWLLLEVIDVTDRDLDSAFKEACAKNQLDVAKWLLTFVPPPAVSAFIHASDDLLERSDHTILRWLVREVEVDGYPWSETVMGIVHWSPTRAEWIWTVVGTSNVLKP